jgi:DNA-binding NtrC family response regulator
MTPAAGAPPVDAGGREVVKWRTSDPVKPPRALQLPEVLEFHPDEGVIRLHEQRVVILSAAAMGLLRKSLIDVLGHDDARRLLLRFGYADGYHDAVSLRDSLDWQDPIEGFRAGAALHTLEGIVEARVVRAAYDEGSGAFEGHVEWRRSYEAEQHLHHYGRSRRPVCWSLVGYVSGFASACVGREIYFKESACLGAGAGACTIAGRGAEAWGAELESLRYDFQGADLRAEIDRLRAAVHTERQKLARREKALAEREREMDVLRERVARHARAKRFVLTSAAMRDVLELAARVAPLDTTVLVHGESGTGKEFVVRMIHEQSERSAGPLVSVNCAALTDTLLESELFGHVRGAFTGAVRDKPGLFEVAASGTLFLDEIGEIAPTVQAKLLRALQEGEIRRVGGERTIKVQPRVIAATNRDLREAIAAGRFREDLYFRLGAFVIAVPPLRERREAIAPLAQEFLRRAATRFKKDVRAIAPEAMSRLLDYDWPGNVRELEHAVERAVIVAHGRTVAVQDLPPETTARARTKARSDSLDLERREREAIEHALERFGGNRKQAADALGISTVTLWRKLKRLRPERRRA